MTHASVLLLMFSRFKCECSRLPNGMRGWATKTFTPYDNCNGHVKVSRILPFANRTDWQNLEDIHANG